MYKRILFYLCVVNPSYCETLSFKKEILNHPHWYSYISLLTFLLLALLLIAKQFKRQNKLPNHCKVIDKIMLKPKTHLYVIEYQDQRFLLAQSSSALSIQPIDVRPETHES